MSSTLCVIDETVDELEPQELNKLSRFSKASADWYEVANDRIFFDFGMISGVYMIFFGVQNAHKSFYSTSHSLSSSAEPGRQILYRFVAQENLLCDSTRI